jgi:hypothetical protein
MITITVNGKAHQLDIRVGELSRNGGLTPPDSALRAESPSPCRGGIRNAFAVWPSVIFSIQRARRNSEI